MMMALPIAVAVSSGIVFFLLLYKLFQRAHNEDGQGHAANEGWSESWFAEFSAFRYLPMRRLLAPEEEEFFVAHSGGSKPGFPFWVSRTPTVYTNASLPCRI